MKGQIDELIILMLVFVAFGLGFLFSVGIILVDANSQKWICNYEFCSKLDIEKADCDYLIKYLQKDCGNEDEQNKAIKLMLLKGCKL